MLIRLICIVASFFFFSLLVEGSTLPLIPVPVLKPGSTIGIVSPSGCISNPASFQVQLTQQMDALGLKLKWSDAWADCDGYLAGTDSQRAASLMAMFSDPQVSMIMASRGGWGCARIIPLLDYSVISKNPKPFMYVLLFFKKKTKQQEKIPHNSLIVSFACCNYLVVILILQLV